MFAEDMASLIDVSAKIAGCISRGLAEADVIIITLGLTECWRNKATGLFVCEGPRDEEDPRRQLLEFHQATFADNYENLSATIAAIQSSFPEKRIIITVSPVPLGRTWTKEDVVVANATSKSTLRAVAGQISREHHDVIYWPSFEFASKGDVYEEDGRHVEKSAVGSIVSAFLEANAI
jgi:hypothetical protein